MPGRIDTVILRLPGLWLALGLTLLLALPGFFTLPPVDRDEARFAQASAQMLASGDWIDIRLGDETRYKKPIGIYWLQASVAALTGAEQQIWAYRLVSLLGALISVSFTYAIGRLALARGPALVAAVALGACLLLGAEARLAKTDAMLLAAVLAGQYVLARLWLPEGRARQPDLPFGWAMAFWAAQAAALLIKGPIGPMVAGFTLAGLCVLRRDVAVLRALRPVPGVALLLAIVLPWLVAITLRSDGAFWQASLGADMLAKIAQGQESHGAPPGTYLVLVWATFWPGSLVLAAGLPALWRQGRRAPLVQFALIWAVPTWLVFELTATKLVHYVLPAYPALALLAVWAMTADRPRPWIAAGLGLVPFAVLAGFAALVWQVGVGQVGVGQVGVGQVGVGQVGVGQVGVGQVGVGQVGVGQVGVGLPWPFWVGLAGLMATVPLILLAYSRAAMGVLAVALAMGGAALSGAIFPSLARIEVLWPAKPLAAFVAAHPECGLRVAGYGEPSVIFLTQNRVRFVDLPGALAGFAAPGCQIVVVPVADQAAVTAMQPAAEPALRIDGFNIGNGRPLALLVFLKP